MKVDLNLETKDYLKLAFFIGTAVAVYAGKAGDDSGVKIAVLETKVEAIGKDVTEIKTMLIRRNR